MPQRTRSRGFSLIESMVALVVLSVGLLGVARMYVMSLQNGRTALFHSQAVSLASDMAERIRANRTATVSYNLLGDPAYPTPPGAAPAAGQNNNCVNGGIDCTPLQLAQNDVFMWVNETAAALPDGSSMVTVNAATNPDTITIMVSWTEQGQGTVQFVMTVQI